MKEILKYQELDLEIQRMEGELLEHADRKNTIKMQHALKDYQAKLVELEKKSKETLKAYNQYKTVYNNMTKNLEVIEKNAETDSVSKIEGLIDAIDAITSNLAMLDKEIATIISNANNVQNEYNTIMKNARSAKANLQKYKDNYNTAKAEADVKIGDKKAELLKQGAKVDKALLAKYKQKSAEKKRVVVPLVAGKCGGCRMEVSAGKLNVLKSSKFIECENCGRIIYLDEKK